MGLLFILVMDYGSTLKRVLHSISASLQPGNKIQRPFFSGEVIPKPVLTSRGFCFALNAKNMTNIFKSNKHIKNFHEVFGSNTAADILTGDHDIVELEIDLQSRYLN